MTATFTGIRTLPNGERVTASERAAVRAEIRSRMACRFQRSDFGFWHEECSLWAMSVADAAVAGYAPSVGAAYGYLVALRMRQLTVMAMQSRRVS